MRSALIGALSAVLVILIAVVAFKIGEDHGPRPRDDSSSITEKFTVPSESMEPTIPAGSEIQVLLNAYQHSSPRVGDIVVITAPVREMQLCGTTSVQDIVKRIIATPGDRLSSVGNTIYLNNHPLRQGWTHASELGMPIETQTVPSNSYFVLGDNEIDSCDSRVWGDVPRSDIVGRVISIGQ